jgi:hypothetical protein
MRENPMLPPQEHALAVDIADRLIELYTLRAEACGQEDWHRVRRLEARIERAVDCRAALRGQNDNRERV